MWLRHSSGHPSLSLLWKIRAFSLQLWTGRVQGTELQGRQAPPAPANSPFPRTPFQENVRWQESAKSRLQKRLVLVCLCSFTRIAWVWEFTKSRSLFLTFLAAEESKIKAQAGSVSEEGCSLPPRWYLVHCIFWRKELCVLTRQKVERQKADSSANQILSKGT